MHLSIKLMMRLWVARARLICTDNFESIIDSFRSFFLFVLDCIYDQWKKLEWSEPNWVYSRKTCFHAVINQFKHHSRASKKTILNRNTLMWNWSRCCVCVCLFPHFKIVFIQVNSIWKWRIHIVNRCIQFNKTPACFSNFSLDKIHHVIKCEHIIGCSELVESSMRCTSSSPKNCLVMLMKTAQHQQNKNIYVK